MLVVGKEASTLSTLHGIANCVKNGANKKNCILQPMSASRSSVAHNYFRPSLRILFTAFLETKPQLWKLMSAISGCCIGSNGSPLHPPLVSPGFSCVIPGVWGLRDSNQAYREQGCVI